MAEDQPTGGPNSASTSELEVARPSVAAVDTVISTGNYSCGAKRYCTQMNSCEEAQYYYRQCGLSRLDGDNDGIPCENVCS
jgi:hypothetical protein